MNIIVCVKQVPASNETRLDPVTHTILRDGAAILNPFDAYAVEEALRLREKLGGEITALSMGVPAAQRMLRDVLALGVDRAVLLTDRAFAGSDTLATATALSAAVRHLGGAGLILCGRMASDGDTAQVGPMLATMLGCPASPTWPPWRTSPQHSARLLRLTDEGYQRVETSLPAVLTVVKEINVPRLPSIAGVLRGEQGEVRCLTAQSWAWIRPRWA